MDIDPEEIMASDCLEDALDELLDVDQIEDCNCILTTINEAMKLGATFIVYEMHGTYIAEVQKDGYPIELKKGASPVDAILNLALND
jgi:hypothetical protein